MKTKVEAKTWIVGEKVRKLEQLLCRVPVNEKEGVPRNIVEYA